MLMTEQLGTAASWNQWTSQEQSESYPRRYAAGAVAEACPAFALIALRWMMELRRPDAAKDNLPKVVRVNE